ncbi:uncharacterized protein LOC107701977 [Sinocyclocheilus anshuiensis]|uniref:uncharacterized protein LOC107701977 n=1 Tax=Sinocyclocheilus anshuiensis TaxID=1608454 RepID=UPI0007B7E365|nr:PREDICTED: uncharacterized protein LOC107701977 [Sinocyclocheilus anshuiensis]
MTSVCCFSDIDVNMSSLQLFHWLQTVRNSNKLKPHTFIWRFGSINRGAAASANQTHSEQRDLQHRDPDMTPTIISKEQLPLNNKLRKPRVEKMRRDRINSSIEQLKCLLAPEFLKQQPDTKLEKADILEMTLNFFRINRRESVLPDQNTFGKEMNVNMSTIWRPWLFHWLQIVRNSNKLKPHTFIWRFGSINRGAAVSANQTHSEQRDLQHSDPDMTPTIISKEQLPLNNKLRKPRVEKMRRDRINSSIEQLKCLLAPEFLKQQPDTNSTSCNTSSHAVNQGFSRCVREIVHFLSKDEMKTESQRRLLKHFQKLQTSCEQNRRESVLPDQNTFSKEMNVNKSSIWRPWWSLTATSSTC